MDRILVMCASRDRPAQLRTMIDSVHETSVNADVAVDIDEDQRAEYSRLGGVRLVVGPRIGPCQSLNCLFSTFNTYLAYGAATDDCTFLTHGWDNWVLRTARSFKNGIGVMAPYLEGQVRTMDFPWATAAFIRTVGFFAYSKLYHFYWDVLLEILGEGRCAAYAGPDDFQVAHPTHPSSNLAEHMLQDSHEFTRWCAFHRKPAIRELEAAIAA